MAEMEDGQFESSPQFTASAPKKKINKRFIYLIALVIFLVVAFLGYKVLGSSKPATLEKISAPTPTLEAAPTDTPTPAGSLTPTTEPTDTPTPKPTAKPTSSAGSTTNTTTTDRSGITITVQNGSGEAGVATSGKEFLTGLGYTVSATGNADNYDYTNVTIQVKKASATYLSLLKKDINTKYTVGDTSSDLPDSFSTDALVIIGK